MELRKEKSKDPLSVLFKSHEYMEGYKEGRLEGALFLNKISIGFQTLLDKVNFMVGVRRQKVKLYGIKNGDILLRKKFDTKDDAWTRIYEMCGEKIDPTKSSFRVVKL